MATNSSKLYHETDPLINNIEVVWCLAKSGEIKLVLQNIAPNLYAVVRSYCILTNVKLITTDRTRFKDMIHSHAYIKTRDVLAYWALHRPSGQNGVSE